MGFFKRGNKKKGKDGGESSDSTPTDSEGEKARAGDDESSPQRVGVVSGVLSTSAEGQDTPFGDIVSRRFGQQNGESNKEGGDRVLPPQHTTPGIGQGGDDVTAEPITPATESEGRDHLRAVASLFPDDPAQPELEVDPMAHIGRATTITGNIVAEEDLEIQGTIEGSVRLANHQVTIGAEGHVQASVEAQIVMVYGKITGDVVASDLVEIEKGGIVGGDIKAPRIIMHDGAIIVGGLDMSASLPNGGGNYEAAEIEEPRPHLTPVAAIDSDEPDASDDETDD